MKFFNLKKKTIDKSLVEEENVKTVSDSLSVFNNEAFGQVRVISDENGETWFCLKDVCECLGLMSHKAAQRIDKRMIKKFTLSTKGGNQQFNFVNEDGLYDVILGSRKKEARAFRKWVTSEVLPSIRKTGGYIPSNGISDTEILAKALEITKRTLENKVNLLTPKAEYYDTAMSLDHTYSTTQIAQELGMSARKLHRKLKDLGVIYWRSNGWFTTAKYTKEKICRYVLRGFSK